MYKRIVKRVKIDEVELTQVTPIIWKSLYVWIDDLSHIYVLHDWNDLIEDEQGVRGSTKCRWENIVNKEVRGNESSLLGLFESPRSALQYALDRNGGYVYIVQDLVELKQLLSDVVK